ncbi:MAG TPA: tetratricopeptide repeat protein [Thermoanaerobaculia bacterium]|nr:tetratricopeptide repeat protein [Thermoanaerobaculia bacterium]
MNDHADLDEPLDSDGAPLTPVVRRLIVQAHSLLSRVPKDAVAVASLALALARLLSRPTIGDRDTAIELQADAHRELAHALLVVGDFDRARIEADQAQCLYSLAVATLSGDEFLGEYLSDVSTDSEPELLALVLHRVMSAGTRDSERSLLEKATVFGLILGQILHGQGDTAQGLWLIAKSTDMLLSIFEDNKKYVEGRVLYATVLLGAHRYADALNAFEETAAIARELNDNVTAAHIVNNYGVCYYYLSNPTKARECAQTALQMFEELGLGAEAVRPRLLLATLLIEDGKYHLAVPALYMNLNTYLTLGLPNEAATVMLKIAKALILGGRSSTIDWQATIKMIQGAAPVRPAILEVLRQLEAQARRQPLLLEDVQRAERMVNQIDTAPDFERDAG